MTTTTTKTATAKSNSKPRAAKKPKRAPSFDPIAEAIDMASTGDTQAIAFLRETSDPRAAAFIEKLDTSRAAKDAASYYRQPGINDTDGYLPPVAPEQAQPVDLYAAAEAMGIPVIPVIVEDAGGNVVEVATKEQAKALKAERPNTAHVYALRTAYTLGNTPEQRVAMVRQTLEAFGPIAHAVARLALSKLVGDAGVCGAIKEASAALPVASRREASGGSKRAVLAFVDGKVVRESKTNKRPDGASYVSGFKIPLPANVRVRITVEMID